ncbi:hypothetical protein N9E34_02165 [Opitutales bacterium]|nr:hypothetical protein [Opitutales bacterium]
MDNILISINSFQPQNFVGWPKVAIEIYKKKSAKILCAYNENQEDVIKNNIIVKNQINPKDIYSHEYVTEISDATLILLEPFNLSLIPKDFVGKLVVSLCGYKKENLIQQINELKGISYELLLSEFTHDELFEKGIHNSPAIFGDKFHFIPPAFSTNQNNNKTSIIFNKTRIFNSVTDNSVTQASDEVVKKVLTENGKIEFLDFNQTDNEYCNLNSNSKILSLINYPQLDFLSFIKDTISNKIHICNSYPKFSLLRQIFFCNCETNMNIELFRNGSIRNQVLKLLDTVHANDTQNDLFLEEFAPSRISDFILSEYQNSNSDNSLNLINSISSKFEFANIDIQNFYHSKCEYIRRLCKTSFNIAAFEHMCNSNKISKRNVYEHIFREELTGKYTSKTVTLTSKMLEINADIFFESVKNTNAESNSPYLNLYYSLLTNTFSTEIIERTINAFTASNDNEINLLIPNLYFLLNKKENGTKCIDNLFTKNNLNITHFYHSLSTELFHPKFRSVGREVITYIIKNYYEPDTSYDIKSSLCWANAFSSIECFDKGYQIISSLVDSKKISEIYLHDYFVTSLCFLDKDSITNNNLRVPDIHQLDAKFCFNYIAIFLFSGKIKESEIIIRHVLNSFSRFEEIGNCSLNKVIPFLLYGLTTSNQEIIDATHNILKYNFFANFPIDYKYDMKSNLKGCGVTQQKLIKFLS